MPIMEAVSRGREDRRLLEQRAGLHGGHATARAGSCLRRASSCRLKPAVESITVGDPSRGEVDMGPVISQEQLDRVDGFVDRARSSGARPS